MGSVQHSITIDRNVIWYLETDAARMLIQCKKVDMFTETYQGEYSFTSRIASSLTPKHR